MLVLHLRSSCMSLAVVVLDAFDMDCVVLNDICLGLD